MFARHLIDASIPPVKSNISVDRALSIMQDNYLHALPVIQDEEQFVGVITEDILLDIVDIDATIEAYATPSTAIHEDEHFFNILRNKDLLKNAFIPVVDHENTFQGVISNHSMIEFLSRDRSIEEQGGIIVLEIKSINYSMAEISRIVESNHANIIHSYISSSTNNENILITLKINKNDLKDIVMTFERFNYQIVAVYHTSEYEEGFKERYDSLMVYLNV